MPVISQSKLCTIVTYLCTILLMATTGISFAKNIDHDLPIVDESENREIYSHSRGRRDTAPDRVSGSFLKGSHVKLFVPNLPYLAISHSINAALVRPANNEQGWEYDLAVNHTHQGNKIFDFTLKKNIKFQDGTPFDADSVLLNMKYFKLRPYTYTKLYKIFDRVEKLSQYKVRFVLTEAYGVFIHDAIWLQFYTKSYLEKFGWNGKSTAPNLAAPGPYGLGPYILKEGYIEGDRSTGKAVLKANPNYWGDNKPKVETITVYTSLEQQEAIDLTLHREGELDISSIPFENEVETVLSDYAKLVISASTNNYAMHFNMINGSKGIMNDKIRYAINHCIDQEQLLNFAMLGEGVLSPTMVSPLFPKVDQAISLLDGFLQQEQDRFNEVNKIVYLRQIVTDFQSMNGLDPSKPLEISILAQESFLFLVKNIQFFLAQINIKLVIDLVKHEKLVFKELFTTYEGQNEKKWDILLWGNYDWYKHPWAAFFVYRPNNAWSTVPDEPYLSELTNQLLAVNVKSPKYIQLIASFIKYVYQNNYMLFLPSPNIIYAVNKEVVFHPRKSAFIPLWELEVTDLHWSVRGESKYPTYLKKSTKVTRENF